MGDGARVVIGVRHGSDFGLIATFSAKLLVDLFCLLLRAGDLQSDVGDWNGSGSTKSVFLPLHMERGALIAPLNPRSASGGPARLPRRRR